MYSSFHALSSIAVVAVPVVVVARAVAIQMMTAISLGQDGNTGVSSNPAFVLKCDKSAF